MSEERVAPVPSLNPVQTLGILHHLTLEALLSENQKELSFRILNRTIDLLNYDRAVLWRFDNNRPVLAGISGQSSVEKHSPLAVAWRGIVKQLGAPTQTTILGTDLGNPGRKELGALAAQTSGLTVAWVPIKAGEKTVAALWLERWGTSEFHEAELKLLNSLAIGYGGVWQKLSRRSGPFAFRKTWPQKGTLALIVLAVLGTCLLPVRLRIVAPCEVVPREPYLVAAPLEGVIAQVYVHPGQEVDKDDLLFEYDSRIALEKVKVARKQVEIVEASITRSRLQAFDNAQAKSEIKILEPRLEQEKAQLNMALLDASRLQVTASTDGTVVIDDPDIWRGKPVQLGERVLLLVDPAKTKLRIWLPEEDNITFDPLSEASIILNADLGSNRSASLTYVSKSSSFTPDGMPAFLAEADWQKGSEMGLRMGLKGSAVLYGKKVSLAYWLVRKPWAAIRRFLAL